MPAQAHLTPSSGVPPYWAASLPTHPTAYGNVTFALQIFFYIDIYSLSYLQFLTKKKKKMNSHPDRGPRVMWVVSVPFSLWRLQPC